MPSPFRNFLFLATLVVPCTHPVLTPSDPSYIPINVHVSSPTMRTTSTPFRTSVLAASLVLFLAQAVHAAPIVKRSGPLQDGLRYKPPPTKSATTLTHGHFDPHGFLCNGPDDTIGDFRCHQPTLQVAKREDIMFICTLKRGAAYPTWDQRYCSTACVSESKFPLTGLHADG